MKLMKLKNLLLLAAAGTVLPGMADVVFKTVEKWSGGGKSLTAAVNSAQAGDTTIIQLSKDLTVNSDVEVRGSSTWFGSSSTEPKKIIITSNSNTRRTIYNKSYTYRTRVYAGATLVMSNIVYDCSGEEQAEDVFLLNPQTVSGGTTNVARMILEKGATVKDAVLKSVTGSENAVFHVKEGAVLTIREGAEILNCVNNSDPGKGGAICCDYGTVIMTGGTIAGCLSKGDGGAIHTDGTRVETADHYGINARGDIYISGGYITNNTCAAGKRGGAIYLGNSGPVLHITGTAVISNNFSGTVADDVSTYNLENAYANRLKLVDYHDSNPEGFTYAGQLFTGWVGVRYPDKEQTPNPNNTRFGAVWEYFNGNQEEARQFFWNGDNEYRGRIDGNALIWSKHVVHELPKDSQTVVALIASGESPIYMELSQNYKMRVPAVVPENVELILDLKGFDLECDFHISNATARVTIFDSSTNKSGTVTGHRDSSYPNAFYLEGGSYATLPKPEWVASNCVVVGNYCENHPYMVAIKVWDADHERIVTDLTKVPLNETEIREVTFDANGVPDIGKITFSSGDWKFMAYTNMDYRVQVLAAPAVQNQDGSIVECGPRVSLFDTHESSDIAPSEAESNDSSAVSFSHEDEFTWDAASYGLVKLIHITSNEAGGRREPIAEETAYFRFPEALFEVSQRNKAAGDKLPITVVDALLTSLSYNRAEGFRQENVSSKLDVEEDNGLRKWENIVTGTDKNQLLLSTAAETGDGLALKIALTDENKEGRTDTGYNVFYDLRKHAGGSWTRVGEIRERPSFSVPLLDADGKSANASGFYRVTTLIIPDGEKYSFVTNEIPSTNIVGVLEVASTLTNTLAAVPWVTLGEDPAVAEERPVTVSKYVHASHLDDDDAVQVADKGHIYRKWHWDKPGGKWGSAITVTRSGVEPAIPAGEHHLQRNSAVWVERRDPAAKPFFLIGQYSNAPLSLTIEGGSPEAMVCTLVPNPSMQAVRVNDYDWKNMPLAGGKGDVIRIPNEKKVPLNLTWNGKTWGRWVKQQWKDDATVPAGTGFWYMRRGGAFEISLPVTEVE